MDKTCPECPDGHRDPRQVNWGVSTPISTTGNATTEVHVGKSNGSHMSEGDAKWIRQMLRNDPHVLLEELKLLGGDGPLGEYLPGLVAVLDALGEQIAEAQEKRDLDMNTGANQGGHKYQAPRVPRPPPGTSINHVVHYSAADVEITKQMFEKQIKDKIKYHTRGRWLK